MKKFNESTYDTLTADLFVKVSEREWFGAGWKEDFDVFYDVIEQVSRIDDKDARRAQFDQLSDAIAEHEFTSDITKSKFNAIIDDFEHYNFSKLEELSAEEAAQTLRKAWEEKDYSLLGRNGLDAELSEGADSITLHDTQLPFEQRIEQGSFGSCQILALINEIAERDGGIAYLENKVTSKEDGTYDVTFHGKRGKDMVINVDPEKSEEYYLNFSSDTAREDLPVNIQANAPEFIQIIEMAYMKAWDEKDGIFGGVRDSMQGSMLVKADSIKAEKFVDLDAKDFEAAHIKYVSFPDLNDSVYVDGVTLTSRHAYTAEFDYDRGTVQLINPWEGGKVLSMSFEAFEELNPYVDIAYSQDFGEKLTQNGREAGRSFVANNIADERIKPPPENPIDKEYVVAALMASDSSSDFFNVLETDPEFGHEERWQVHDYLSEVVGVRVDHDEYSNFEQLKADVSKALETNTAATLIPQDVLADGRVERSEMGNFSHTMVETIQMQLSQKGYMDENINLGHFDDETAAALQAFQKDTFGIIAYDVENMVADQATLAALNLEVANANSDLIVSQQLPQVDMDKVTDITRS